MQKIRKGDMVRIIAGKDKGSEGKVLSVNNKNDTVIVEGVNQHTKHLKPGVQSSNGGILTEEAPIHVSNVMYLHKGEPTKIGFRFEGDKKVRFARKTGETID